jgi:tRNA threonylcarbamoyladenosine modification (KEOPS) complex Cgi121 subunit
MITRPIADSDLYVSMAGARNIHVDDVDETLELVRTASEGHLFQLFDARLVAGWRHLYYAAVNAFRAVENGVAVSKGLDVETLLYATCQDQIARAFSLMGVSKKTREVAVVVFGRDPDVITVNARRVAEVLGDLDDHVLDVDEAKYTLLRKAFEVSDASMETVGGDPYEALTSLIVEKGALMALRR